MASTVTSNYAGEVLDFVKMKLTTENELFQKGLVNLIPKIMGDVHVPKWTATEMIGARANTPSASIGDNTWTETTISVGEFMLYHRFLPRNFESVWRKYQPTGQLVFRELPPAAQKIFFDLIMKTAQATIERVLLTGNTGGGSAPDNIIDGLETQLTADGSVNAVGTPLTLSAGNIEGEFDRCFTATPSVVRRHPDFKWLINYNTQDLYQQAIKDQTYKGNDFTSAGPMTHRGKPVVAVNGLSDNTIIGGVFSPNIDSNLHVAMDWNQESLRLGESVLHVDRLQNDSIEYFVRGDFKMGIGYSFPEEITYYDG